MNTRVKTQTFLDRKQQCNTIITYFLGVIVIPRSRQDETPRTLTPPRKNETAGSAERKNKTQGQVPLIGPHKKKIYRLLERGNIDVINDPDIQFDVVDVMQKSHENILISLYRHYLSVPLARKCMSCTIRRPSKLIFTMFTVKNSFSL